MTELGVIAISVICLCVVSMFDVLIFTIATYHKDKLTIKHKSSISNLIESEISVTSENDEKK